MASFAIEGGHRIEGTVSVSGNKNAAFPLIAASLLTDETVTLENVPQIDDVDTILSILEGLGVYVHKERGPADAARRQAARTRARRTAVQPHPRRAQLNGAAPGPARRIPGHRRRRRR